MISIATIYLSSFILYHPIFGLTPPYLDIFPYVRPHNYIINEVVMVGSKLLQSSFVVAGELKNSITNQIYILTAKRQQQMSLLCQSHASLLHHPIKMYQNLCMHWNHNEVYHWWRHFSTGYVDQSKTSLWLLHLNSSLEYRSWMLLDIFVNVNMQ